MTTDRIKMILSSLPTHVALIGLCLIWLIPTFGLLVTSLRPFQDINQNGWWTAFTSRKEVGQDVYEKYLASYYGPDGKAVAGVDLSDPELIGQFRRSIELTVFLRKQMEEGKVQLEEMPDPQETADLLTYLRQLSGAESAASRPRFTANNYIDALMGYRGICRPSGQEKLSHLV